LNILNTFQGYINQQILAHDLGYMSEDIYQDAVKKIIKYLPRYDKERASVYTYVSFILRSVIYDSISKKVKEMKTTPLPQEEVTKLYDEQYMDCSFKFENLFTIAKENLSRREYSLLKKKYILNKTERTIAKELKMKIEDYVELEQKTLQKMKEII
jgi:RNA polymerase sigma factor (sigma-70 family)